MGIAEADDGTEKATLHDREIDKYLFDCVTIEPTAIDEEFIRLPSDLAYWNECLAEAIREHLRAESECARVKAAISIELREIALEQGLKITVDDLKAKALLEPQVQRAELRSVEAESKRHLLRLRCEAISAKKDMLQSLGAKIRAEMIDPAVREQHIGHKLSSRR